MENINRKRKRDIIPKKKIVPKEPAPYVIVVHGPPKVGKSSLIKTLVKHYTNHNLTHTERPITILAGEDQDQRRIQFVECPNNVSGMIDAAKYADAVILVIDVSFGFEMETFEFVNLLKVHGTPIVMGVFTHLDCFLNELDSDEVRTARIQNDFRDEICQEAQIFCLSAPADEMYADPDIFKLASFILGMEFHPLSWRDEQPYVLVDRFEECSPPYDKYFREIIFYGYLRGCDFKKGTKVHIAGIGDYSLSGIIDVAEPPPLQRIDGTDPKASFKRHGLKCLDDPFRNLKETQVKKKIFRMGSYLMFKARRVKGSVCDLICGGTFQPILVGGISPNKDCEGHILASFERHSLHMKSLKTKDPITISVGWRRYITTPVYAPKNLRGILESTPKDKPCCAMFYGPFATSGTGFVAVQSLADNKAAFRILGTGKYLRFNPCADSHMLVSRRVGTPCKITNRTALIKDMFTSDTDIMMYTDTEVKTVSGVRGEVNEPATKKLLNELKWKDGQLRHGIAKCTFDRGIRLTDTVSLETIMKFHPTKYEVTSEFLGSSNRVWADGTNESEKSGALVVWASREKKLAPEDLRLYMSKLQEEKLKLPCQKRLTEELRRAVIIVLQLSDPNAKESAEAFAEAYRKRKEEVRGGRVTKIFPKKQVTAVAKK